MTTRHQIHYVCRSDRLNHDERVRAVGGVNPDGSRWRLTQQAAIDAIEKGRWSFFISRAGHDVDIVVALSKYGRKYIKTSADGLHPDNLLTLPECS